MTEVGLLGSEPITILLTFLLPIVAVFLFKAANIHGDVVGVTAGSMGTLVGALKLGSRHRSKSRDERVLEAGEDSDHANPLLLALMAASLIVAIEFLAGAFVGAVGSSALAVGVSGLDPDQMTAFTGAIILFAYLLVFVAVIPIGKQLSLRAPSDPRRWIAVAVVGSRLLSLLAGAAMGENIGLGPALLHIAVIGLALFGAGMIGHLLARRARDGFAAARLLKAFDRPERRAFLDRMRAEATATAAVHTRPAVPAPAVHAPAVPAPAVHGPAVHAPAVHAPAVPAHVVPAPVVPAPVVRAPVVPVPTIPVPTVATVAPMRVRRAKAPTPPAPPSPPEPSLSPPSPPEPSLPATMRVRRPRPPGFTRRRDK